MRVPILACFVCLSAPVSSFSAMAQVFVSAGQMGGLDTEGEGAGGVAVDREGNVTVIGSFDHTGDFDPGPAAYWMTGLGIADPFIVRFDHQGRLLWAGSMSGPGWDSAGDLALDAAGDILFVGSAAAGAFDADPGPGTFIISSTSGEGFLSKVDRGSGNLIWARQIAHPQASSFSSSGNSVALDAGGNIHVAGSFNNGTVDCDPGPGTFNLSTTTTSYFISKLDSTGALVWARQLGGSPSSPFSLVYIHDLLVDAGGNLTMTGRFSGTVDFDPGPGTFPMTASGNNDGFIARLDPAGNFVWAGRLGGNGDDVAARAALDADGSLYVTGHFQVTADFNPGPGSFLMTTTDGAFDAFVGKFTSAGGLVWARQLGGSGLQYGTTLALDAARGIITTGSFNHAGDFNPGPGVFTLEPPGGPGTYGTYLSHLDPAGNFVSASVLGQRYVSAATADVRGDLYLVGGFQGTDDFEPGPGTHLLTAVGRSDAYISRLGWPCPRFNDRSAYGQLVLPDSCTREAFPLTADLYASTQVPIERGSRDRFFLSSTGGAFGEVLGPVFAPLVADDRIRINGIDLGLGPYAYQPDVPPIHLYTPIESTLVPLPAPELGTNLIPTGSSTMQVEILDADRNIYGHTALYLVRDCGLALAGSSPTSLNWISHDAEITGTNPLFEVRYGLLSHLQQDRDFSRIACLGHFSGTPATDAGPDPLPGDGYYYMGRGLDTCVEQGYGTSSLIPDPRAALDALPACP
ncbi:MAG TPA: hypothetical protein VFD06_04105 [Candidatus Polarisedimenticolia bacterium]|nr:hypothetical protein [Candidatus Polarisedimenticolia bacterium]